MEERSPPAFAAEDAHKQSELENRKLQYLALSWSVLRLLLCPIGYLQDILRDKNIVLKLTECVDPFIRVIDGIVGECVSMRVSICTHLLLIMTSMSMPQGSVLELLMPFSHVGFVWAD